MGDGVRPETGTANVQDHTDIWELDASGWEPDEQPTPLLWPPIVAALIVIFTMSALFWAELFSAVVSR